MRPGSSLVLTVHDRLERVDLAAWERIRDTDNLFTDPAWVRAVRDAEIVAHEPQLFEFRHDDRLVCTMSGGILNNDLAMFAASPLRTLVAVVRHAFPRFLRARTLEIGPIFGSGHSVSHAADTTPAEWHEVVRQVQAHARRRDVALVLFRQFGGTRHPMEDALLSCGCRKLYSLPVAEMLIRWDTFDDYLAALRRKRRWNILRKIRRKQELGIRTVFVDDNLERVARYLELVANVQTRTSPIERVNIGTAYHESMLRHLRGRSLWLQYLRGDTLVGFAHSIRYGRQLHVMLAGLDYDVSTKAALYFNLFYDEIKLAFDEALDCVRAGITTYEAKSDVGFSIRPQVMYLWMPNRLVLAGAARLWNRTIAFGIENCRPAFREPGLQYLWDGRSDDPERRPQPVDRLPRIE